MRSHRETSFELLENPILFENPISDGAKIAIGAGVVAALGLGAYFLFRPKTVAASTTHSTQPASTQPAIEPVRDRVEPPPPPTIVGGSINDRYVYIGVQMWNGTAWQPVEEGWMLTSHAYAILKSVGHAFWLDWSIWQPSPTNAWHYVQTPPDGQLDVAL